MAYKSQRPKQQRPVRSRSANQGSRRTIVRVVAGLIALMMVGSLAFVVVGTAGSNSNQVATPTLPSPEKCPAPDKSDAPRLAFNSRPTWCLEPGVNYTAVFDTTEGKIRVALDKARTPETVNNFVVLSRYGYYDTTMLFRFDPSIDIIQGGAPNTNDWSDQGPGYNIPDEGGQFLSTASGQILGPFAYQQGDLVMARSSGPDSSGAQFFFAAGPQTALLDANGSYIVFGRADEDGIEVLQSMMGLYVVDESSQYGGGPSRDVFVRSVTIEVD